MWKTKFRRILKQKAIEVEGDLFPHFGLSADPEIVDRLIHLRFCSRLYFSRAFLTSKLTEIFFLSPRLGIPVITPLPHPEKTGDGAKGVPLESGRGCLSEEAVRHRNPAQLGPRRSSLVAFSPAKKGAAAINAVGIPDEFGGKRPVFPEAF